MVARQALLVQVRCLLEKNSILSSFVLFIFYFIFLLVLAGVCFCHLFFRSIPLLIESVNYYIGEICKFLAFNAHRLFFFFAFKFNKMVIVLGMIWCGQSSVVMF